MPRYRNALPQLGGRPFITDGGLETTLLFLEKVELPCFAAFPLVRTEEGRALLARFVQPCLELARQYRAGMILDTPTWRANADWGARLGYDADALATVNRDAVSFVEALRQQDGNADLLADLPIVLNGVIGPRGDGYATESVMTAAEAADYHAPQIAVFRDTEVDMVSAVTLTYVEEAVGIALAAKASAMPVVISFTVETDGRLPSGRDLGSAIVATDAATDGYPAYYMINCAHPVHFEPVLVAGSPWLDRVRGVRANASKKSHAELDTATDLDIGDPNELGRHYAGLRGRLKNLSVLGGCCGTDHRHIEAICKACL